MENEKAETLLEDYEKAEKVKRDSQPYRKRRPWYGRTTLWLTIIGVAVNIYLILEEVSVDKIALINVLIGTYLAKEWHNDIKH